jgi:aspartate racemase
MQIMKLEEDNMIGIVGGMGPEAGATLFNAILAHTNATTDQEHLSVVLMSFPKHIVDRTQYLEGEVPVNPAHAVAAIIGKLEAAGAKVVGIACNTIHAPAILEVITAELHRMKSTVQLVNMPVETCRYLQKHHPGLRRIGVLTSNGTYKTGIYRKLLREWGYEVVVPAWDFQNNIIHRMIYDPVVGLKANAGKVTAQTRQLMDTALAFFQEQQAEAIILGCTELPLVMAGHPFRHDMTIIDSTNVLALALIREAAIYGKEKTGQII